MLLNSRLYLTLGVSTLAICAAAPAFAGTTTTPGVAQSTTGGEVDATLTISNIGDDRTTGVTDTGDSVADANVVSVPTGQVSQTGSATGVGEGSGHAHLTIENKGSLTIQALASGSNNEGNASADAYVESAVYQSAVGVAGAAVDLDNTGTLGVAATAAANAADYANAVATIYGGISQYATADEGDASVALTNSGTLGITADATATGGTRAYADASVEYGIYQSAVADGAGDAAASLANSGTLTISATGVANAGSGTGTGEAIGAESAISGNAYAYGTMDDAISQYATANDGNAAASLTNSGTLAINAAATANAAGRAYADAELEDDIIVQAANAYGPGHDASASIVNSGSLTMAANGVANSPTGYATAYGTADSVISQSAYASSGDASASLTNSGTLAISANASANAASAAYADASLEYGIGQYASASGAEGANSASASLTNSGTLNITADGAAAAGTGYATAYATIYDAVSQTANASGDATVSLTNSTGGTLNIAANAGATGASEGYADASLEYGIYQDARAYGGNASAALANSGALTIAANGTATASTGSASAYGSLSDAISQNAYATHGDAAASLTNSGTLNLTASAVANGASDAYADASNEYGIYQQAHISNSEGGGAGNASASLVNSGTLNITANGAATAGTGDATAYGTIYGGISQLALAPNGDASASLTNSGTLNIAAGAVAHGGDAAYADASNEYAISQEALAYQPGHDASAVLSNSGTVNITANGTASASDGYATAYASIYDAITQYGYAADGNASASLTNSGTLNIAADAAADGATSDARAYASVDNGIYQEGSARGSGNNGSAALANSGTLNITANAAATAGTSYAQATGAISNGITQYAHASAGDAAASLANSGTVKIAATAAADGTSDAYAHATVDTGISQTAATPTGTASAALTNSGAMSVKATADATSGGGERLDNAYGYAFVTPAIYQDAAGPIASSTFANSGTLDVAAAANAQGIEEAYAGASATGIAQSAVGSQASASITNASGKTISVSANATAAANLAGVVSNEESATASEIELGAVEANALGAVQFAAASGMDGTTTTDSVGTLALEDVTSSANFANSGTFNVAANAAANGVEAGSASANAAGLEQYVFGNAAQANFINSGTFSVSALANAAGLVANASAFAGGYGAWGEALDLDVSNSGTLSASAKAAGGDHVEASAVGMGFFGQSLGGTITNTGTLSAGATSSGGENSATATGIELRSASNSATLTNPGKIMASAQTVGGPADATAIRVADTTATMTGTTTTGSTPGLAALDALSPVFTINNTGGVIVARQSTNGGATWKHGLAIDTTASPNPVVINLKGNGATPGYIYGNIDITPVDTINVSSGETGFDGVVNPNGALEGTLNILSGGTLYLMDEPTANTSYDGAALVNVDALSIASGGKLALQLPSYTAGAATYPRIVANTANITGATLEVRPSSPNGLYANSYVYNNIIDANILTGKFATPVIVSTGTPLLQFTASYDNANNVDLAMTRIAFGAVPGLTRNEVATGGGIEAGYSPTQAGPYGTLLANLFLLPAAAYPDALSQLSGDMYASYQQNLRNSSLQVDTLVNDQVDCAISKMGVDACRDPYRNGLRLWALGGYNDSSVNGDGNGTGYDADGYFALLGLDYTTSNFTFGAFGGYRQSKARFDRYDGRIDADGYQVGLLAGYDVGTFYIRGNGSYTALNGDSSRTVGILSTAGTITGQPDVRIWSVYGEAGARLNLGATWLTPFVGVDYTDSRYNAFTETGVPGANLDLPRQSDHQTSFLAGLKWAGNLGGIIPEAKVMYRHDSGDGYFNSVSRFADAPGSNYFTVVSPYTKRDSVMAGFSLAAALGSDFTGRIGYQGRFASDLKDNAFYGSLTYHFGRAAAPPPPAPPPPPPPAPPPPPPPPPAVVCNKGPYIVFFDWDKSDITPEAATILDNAIAAYGNCDSVPIMLAGHTDRSGTAQYNMGLSQRRNASTTQYLTSHGIAAGAITSQAFGESMPRVPSADGVREPQNRRVEITYGPGSGF